MLTALKSEFERGSTFCNWFEPIDSSKYPQIYKMVQYFELDARLTPTMMPLTANFWYTQNNIINTTRVLIIYTI